MSNFEPSPYKAQFLINLGAELRQIREKAGYSITEVSKLWYGKGHPDRLSKVERGISGVEMTDYLRLMWFYRDVVPDHPAVAMARMLLPAEARAAA